MKPVRRWFQFSLRGFFILLTALAVWLGVVVNRAREQREAVEAIEALGGGVSYDWEPPKPLTYAGMQEASKKRKRTKWLRAAIGDDFFQTVEEVNLFLVPLDWHWNNPEKRKEILRQLQRFRNLKTLRIPSLVSQDIRDDLSKALPKCDMMPIKTLYTRGAPASAAAEKTPE